MITEIKHGEPRIIRRFKRAISDHTQPFDRGTFYKDVVCGLVRWGNLHGNTDKMFLDWIEFSEVQCAGGLDIDKAGVKRFLKWKETGDDNEAWT
jgi:hypothetical protein